MLFFFILSGGAFCFFPVASCCPPIRPTEDGDGRIEQQSLEVSFIIPYAPEETPVGQTLVSPCHTFIVSQIVFVATERAGKRTVKNFPIKPLHRARTTITTETAVHKALPA